MFTFRWSSGRGGRRRDEKSDRTGDGKRMRFCVRESVWKPSDAIILNDMRVCSSGVRMERLNDYCRGRCCCFCR